MSLEMTCQKGQNLIRKDCSKELLSRLFCVHIYIFCLLGTLVLQEYAYTQSGFSCLLIKAIASSNELTVSTGRTGPNMSFCMMGSDSVTSVKIVGASDMRKMITSAKEFGSWLWFLTEYDMVMLTNVFLGFYHLPADSHFARSPQYVPCAIEEL